VGSGRYRDRAIGVRDERLTKDESVIRRIVLHAQEEEPGSKNRCITRGVALSGLCRPLWSLAPRATLRALAMTARSATAVAMKAHLVQWTALRRPVALKAEATMSFGFERLSDLSIGSAGEHFGPRELVGILTRLLLGLPSRRLRRPTISRTLQECTEGQP
jgi:hypothetical protein